MNYSEGTRGRFQNMQLGKIALNVMKIGQFLNREPPACTENSCKSESESGS